MLLAHALDSGIFSFHTCALFGGELCRCSANKPSSSFSGRSFYSLASPLAAWLRFEAVLPVESWYGLASSVQCMEFGCLRRCQPPLVCWSDHFGLTPGNSYGSSPT